MNKEINTLQKARPDLDRAYHRDMEQTKQVAALLRRTFDLGAGDTDLYQAFGWRFWHLLAEGGTIGVVLPAKHLPRPDIRNGEKRYSPTAPSQTSHSSTQQREVGVRRHVHQQYTIALCSIGKGPEHVGKVAMRGPYASRLAYDKRSDPAEIQTEEFKSWSQIAAFPTGALRRSVGYVPQTAQPPPA